MCGYGDGVYAEVRHGAVAALAVDVDVEEVEGCHDFAFMHGDDASGQLRPVVQAVYGVHGKALE